jgi:hypothetical protein
MKILLAAQTSCSARAKLSRPGPEQPPLAFLGLPGSIWASLGLPAFLGLPGPPWALVSLGLSGPPCCPGLPWASLGLPGPPWASLGISGPPCCPGLPWASLGLPGPPWASLGISGPPWASLLSWASLGLPGPPCLPGPRVCEVSPTTKDIWPNKGDHFRSINAPNTDNGFLRA